MLLLFKRRGDDFEIFKTFDFNHNITETDINNPDVTSQLEHQYEIQETEESGWMFDKINSTKTRFHKTGE